MGLTNIHHATQVLQYAGRGMVIQAILANHNKLVLLNGRSFHQAEVEAFVPYLQDKRKDIWLGFDKRNVLQQVSAPGPLEAPMLHTSRGVDVPSGRDAPNMAFLMLVRGREAAAATKVRVLYDETAVACAAVEEASQGYTVVFTAALLRSKLPLLGQADVSFKKVDKLSALTAPGAMEEGKMVPLLC
jgi:hypothetical protein